MIKFLNSNNILQYLELCKYSGFNSRPVLENISYNELNEYINEPEHIINEIQPEIIQKGRSKYYLINDKLYKINKNKSQGEFYCDYVSDKIVITKKSQIVETKITKPIQINEPVIATKKPKKIIIKKNINI